MAVGKEIGRLVTDTATGGVGKAVSKAARRRFSGSVRGAAGKAGSRYGAKKGVPSEKSKKLNGWGFWTVFILACVKELLDIFLTFTLVLSLMVTVISLMVSFIVWFYFAANGVRMNKNKMVTFIISMLIEVIPLLSAIPTFPLTMLIIKKIENGGFKKLQKATS